MEIASNPSETIVNLPLPFRDEKFRFLKRGIYDSTSTDVFVNVAGDFAFLHPIPDFDYTHYQPRRKKLGLDAYRGERLVASRRLEKIARFVPEGGALLEIGSGGGAFLSLVRENRPELRLASLEKDVLTKPERDRIEGLEQFVEFEDVLARGRRFDVIGLFHVLEHVVEPRSFLANVRQVSASGARVIIEVPSIDDPLLGIYESEAYGDFFFQRQHPFTYSANSLERLLEANGFKVEQRIAHQRYGLENHLAWLRRGQPGGDPNLRQIFEDCDDMYRKCLERTGKTDAVIAVAAPVASSDSAGPGS